MATTSGLLLCYVRDISLHTEVGRTLISCQKLSFLLFDSCKDEGDDPNSSRGQITIAALLRRTNFAEVETKNSQRAIFLSSRLRRMCISVYVYTWTCVCTFAPQKGGNFFLLPCPRLSFER